MTFCPSLSGSGFDSSRDGWIEEHLGYQKNILPLRNEGCDRLDSWRAWCLNCSHSRLESAGLGTDIGHFSVKASISISQLIGAVPDGVTADLWHEQGVIEMAEVESKLWKVNPMYSAAAGVVDMTSQTSARGQ